MKIDRVTRWWSLAAVLAAGCLLGARDAQARRNHETGSETIPADPGEPGDGATPAVPGGGNAYGHDKDPVRTRESGASGATRAGAENRRNKGGPADRRAENPRDGTFLRAGLAGNTGTGPATGTSTAASAWGNRGSVGSREESAWGRGESVLKIGERDSRPGAGAWRKRASACRSAVSAAKVAAGGASREAVPAPGSGLEGGADRREDRAAIWAIIAAGETAAKGSAIAAVSPAAGTGAADAALVE